MIRLAIVFMLSLSLLFSCSREEARDIMDKDQMAAMLVEFYLREARVKANTVTEDSAAVIFTHLRKAFAQKHGINDSLINRSYNYYLSRPKELQDVYIRVIDTLALREQRAYSSNYQ